MEFFHLIKATQKSGKPDAVHWQTHKTEARANLALDVALEDAEIVTGRGQEYNKPVRTDFPVFNDLPEEGVVDFEWCKRYELGDDNRTWYPIMPTSDVSAIGDTVYRNAPSITQGEPTPETPPENVREEIYAEDDSVKFQLATMPFRIQLLAQLSANDRHVYHISIPERKDLSALEMDMDNSYVQNLLLAVENAHEVKTYDMPTLWKLTDAIKKVFPQDKRHELNLFIQFTKTWVRTEHIDRGILTREWAAGNRINGVQRTDSGTNADGGFITDRGEGIHHSLETLDLEIACALLPMDFNHFEIPASVLRRGKEVVAKKEEPWKSWSAILRNQPGVLSVNRTAIFNLVRIAPENIHLTPSAHLEFVNKTMTAEFNSANELLPLAESAPAEPDTNTDETSRKSFCTHEENLQRVREEGARRREEEAARTQIGNLGGGVFSIEGLMNGNQPSGDDNSEVNAGATSNVQIEEIDSNEVQNGTPIQESADATGATQGTDEACVGTDTVDIDTGHHNIDTAPVRLYTHLMLDLETMGKKPGAPIVSMGAVFFDPTTGETGGEFYRVICLESSMYFGAKPDAGTILWRLKQSSEARSAIVVDDAQGLVEALEQFTDFIAENASNGSRNVQLWGNGSSFDCSIIEAAFELADCPFPVPHWNYRDVRTVVEMGKAIGMNSRYEIPFEGDQHNAMADALHQVKYVSAIWQRLTAN